MIKVKDLVQVDMINDVNLVVSEDLIMDCLRDVGVVKSKIKEERVKAGEAGKRLRLDDLEFKKLQIYEQYEGSSLVDETLKDFMGKQARIIPK